MKRLDYEQTAIPCAYFITFTCYGAWLHGEITSVDPKHNIYDTGFLTQNPARNASENMRMTEPPYLLNVPQRQIVLNTVKEVCNYRGWVLLAAHVRTNHVHLVIHANILPEKIMNTIKSYASRHLNASNLDGDRINRWTRHGSTRYLWKEEAVESAIHYVVYEQGKPMSVFENVTRSFDVNQLLVQSHDG